MRWQVSQSWGRSESPAQQAGKRTLPLDAELQGPTVPAARGGGGGHASSDLCCASRWLVQGLAHGRGSRNICGVNGCFQDSQVYLDTRS